MRSRPQAVTRELAVARGRRLLEDVSRPVEQVFRSVELLSEQMLAIAAAATARGRALERRDLVSLRPAVAALLNRYAGFVAGAGVVTDRDALADASLWIEWWWLARDGVVERLEVDLDPESAEFYDYTTTEWFRDPQQTGARHIAGPYVDYICTREYTFTVSVPLVQAGRFIGVAGADILATKVERMIGRSLEELPCVAALASRSGRIISSNTAALMPGAVLGRAWGGPALRAVSGPDDRPSGDALPWVLLTGDDEALR
jgi:hypothetical protein